MIMFNCSDEMHTFKLLYVYVHTCTLSIVHTCLIVRTNVFLFQPLNLCDIDGVSGISVSKEDEVNRRVDIQIKDPAKEVYMIMILRHIFIPA